VLLSTPAVDLQKGGVGTGGPLGRIEVRLLGRFAVVLEGQEIPLRTFGGRLVRQLIRLLVTRRGVHIPKDMLAEGLWGDHPPADPAGNLEILVSRARRALGDPSLILTGPGGYAFTDDDRCWVDGDEFVARVESGHRELAAGRHATALRAFDSALELWSGDPLMEDAYTDWAQEYRRDLSRTHLEALEGGAAAALAVGDPVLAVGLAQQAVGADPLREAGRLLLIHALADSSDTAGALAAFEDLRSRFAEELGLDPSSRALELHGRILRGEPLTLPRAALRADELPFAGREAELAAALSAGRDPGFRVLLVSGTSGAGKSRLLLETVAKASVPTVLASAFLPGQDEPWALARTLLRQALDSSAGASLTENEAWAMREVLPELHGDDLTVTRPTNPAADRSFAIATAVRIIAAAVEEGGLVLVDDVQWADSTSLSLLQALLLRVAGLGLVLAFRAEDVPEGGPVASFLASMLETGSARALALAGLSSGEMSELIADDDLVRAIAEETEALPMVVSGMIHKMSREGDLLLDGRGRWRLRPGTDPARAREVARGGAREVMIARIGHLPAGRKESIAMLALLGRETPARLVAAARKRDEGPILDALRSLSGVGLVRLGDGGWATANHLVTEVVIAGLPKEDRARLHGMLAIVLRQEEAEPSELARHLAGAGDREGAAVEFLEAAQRRLDQIANDEAVALADTALGLLPVPTVRSRLLAVRAEARRRRGDLAGARSDLDEALVGLGPGAVRARILGEMALLQARVEDPVRGGELASLAIADASGDPRARAEALAVGAVVDLSGGQLDRAERRSAEALALVEQAGDVVGMARILYCRAMATLIGGRIREAVVAFEGANAWFVEPGEALRLWNPQATRGHARALMGEAEEGLAEIDAALEWARMAGHPQAESSCRWHRAEALIVLGRTEQAIEAATEGLGIARDLGHKEWTAAGLLAVGVGWGAAGDLDAAEVALRDAMAVAERNPLFASWAGARLARILVRKGDLHAAGSLLQDVRVMGVPLTLYEARLARAELASAQGKDARAMAAEAMRLAVNGGHLASVPRLRELAHE
jgi:DNA-binding SARP family transcriptional activator/tetratricopeptide (TPR) repeat protein